MIPCRNGVAYLFNSRLYVQLSTVNVSEEKTKDLVGQKVIKPLEVKEGNSAVLEDSTPETLTFFCIDFGSRGLLI